MPRRAGLLPPDARAYHRTQAPGPTAGAFESLNAWVRVRAGRPPARRAGGRPRAGAPSARRAGHWTARPLENFESAPGRVDLLRGGARCLRAWTWRRRRWRADGIRDRRSPSPELLETTGPARYRLKVMQDPSWETSRRYAEAMCRKIHDQEKPHLIAVLEHLSTSAHARFRGAPDDAARTVSIVRIFVMLRGPSRSLCRASPRNIPLRKLDPRCRPADGIPVRW